VIKKAGVKKGEPTSNMGGADLNEKKKVRKQGRNEFDQFDRNSCHYDSMSSRFEEKKKKASDLGVKPA